MFCRPIVLRLLNFATGIIQVTEAASTSLDGRMLVNPTSFGLTFRHRASPV
jgi:hypothetical protein